MSKIFLSHSSLDKKPVRFLANRLKEAGFDVWLDEWEIKVGESISGTIERGIHTSDYLAIWLTADSVASGWVDREWRAMFLEEVETELTRVLPLLAENIREIPFLLRDKLYADFRTSFDDGFAQLLDALEGAYNGSDDTITRSSWESYGWLFNIGGLRIPYIPLLVNPQENIHLVQPSQISCTRDMVAYKLPKEFRNTPIPPGSRNLVGCVNPGGWVYCGTP